MTALAVAFSLLLVGSFFYGEYTKLGLKDAIHQKTVSEATLETKLKETSTEASTKGERVKQLEEELRVRTDENMALTQKLAREEQQLTALLARESELEERVKALDEQKKSSELRLRAEAMIFENDNLAVKLRRARASVLEARSTGRISGDVAEGLLLSISEAESVVDEARSGRIAVEKMLSGENLGDMERLTGDGDWVGELVRKDREQTEYLVKRYQENLREKARGDFKERLEALEERLVDLSESKKVIEEKWTEAMTAMLRMDETAGRIEVALRSGAARDSYETLDFATPEGLSRLLGEMETLRKAREDVASVMEKIKETIEGDIEAETMRMLSETSRVSHALNDLFLDGKAPEYERVALSVEGGRGGSPEERLAHLSRQLEGLNVVVEGGIVEVPAGAAPGVTGEKRDFDIYVVKAGDTLWKIAARKDTYGNPYMWPVIYKDNALQLQDPNIIHPQLKLVIRKDLSSAEVSSALKEGASGKTPDVDRNYLREWFREICSSVATTPRQ